MDKRALINKRIRRNVNELNKIRANEEKEKIEAEELEKRKQEAVSETIKRKRNAADEIKDYMSLHGNVLSAMELSKLASISLLMSSLYMLAIGADNRLLYFLTFGALLLTVLFNFIKVDMESTIYNYSISVDLVYEDVNQDETFKFNKYKKIMNSHEEYRIRKLVRSGVDQVNKELSGEPVNNYVAPLPRYIIHNYRDLAIKTFNHHEYLSSFERKKALVTLVISAVMVLLQIFVDIPKSVNELYTLIYILIGIISIKYFIESIRYEIKHKSDKSIIETFTKILGG